jgi:hypothetical protein
MTAQERTAKVKDYPGTGCPICWTRKNLNECIGSQYLTVQELTHMVSHWRTQISESGFGGAELFNQMYTVLEASFGYFESFSEWRMAHERAELFNFMAEDKSLDTIDAYSSLVFSEGFRFDLVVRALTKIEELCKQLEAARSKALEAGANPADAKEAEQFAQLTAALVIARQSFDTTAEARQRYVEKASAYAANRKAQAKADAKVKASTDSGAGSCAASSPEPKADSSAGSSAASSPEVKADSSPPAANRTGCGCKKN